KYRKKPIVIDATMFELGMEDGFKETFESMGENVRGIVIVNKPYIKTLEGEYFVEEGKHYIVTGVRGERYPVEKEIFEETYELVEEGSHNEKCQRCKRLFDSNSSHFSKNRSLCEWCEEFVEGRGDLLD